MRWSGTLAATLLLVMVVAKVNAQTAYLPLHTDEYHLIDRMETLNGILASDFLTSWKPLPRKHTALFLSEQKRLATFQQKGITAIDEYNINRAISLSGEWIETADGSDGVIRSERPILRHFYRTQPNFIHVHTDDFFVVVNPVIYAQGMYEKGQDGLRYINTRGAEIRGSIKNRIGFYSLLADNQEKAISYIQQWSDKHQAFPGNDYYLNPAAGMYDIFMARGYIDVSAWKEKMNITFGYDKNFTGDGMRSLLLSDFGAPATFLRLRTNFGKLHYENLFMELTSDYNRGTDIRLPRKYLSMHQLAANVNRWLHIGVFESTIYGRGDKFSISNLMPIIGYNTAARALGAQQKTSWGLNFKAVVFRSLQIYGQAFADQIRMEEWSEGSLHNQFGLQLGTKYFNVFGIANLDAQAEANWVRPFAYSATDSITNFTHYNQPLAHPYGSGFAEAIGMLRYQPVKKLLLSAKGIYAIRGEDSSATVNFGNNIFKPSNSATQQTDLGALGPNKINSIYLNLHVAYELRPNLYLEAGGVHLRRATELLQLPSVTYIYGGLRWNIARKEFDYF